MTHRYSDMLGWLQAGQQILGKWRGGVEGHFPVSFNSREVAYAVDGAEGWEFRLKPRTVKIGSREVEAPVLDPVKLTHVFFLDTSRVGEQCRFNSIVYNPTANPPNIEQLRSRGLLFASLEDAKAFHDALSELLTGGAV